MADASPTWGNWITHVDSVGQAPTMKINFNESKTLVAILFDRMVLSLNDRDPQNLARTIGFAGYFPLTLPDEFPLAGYLLIVRGIVIKSHDTSAILTGSIGEKTFAQEWPRTGGIDHVGGAKSEPQSDIQEFEFVIPCFTPDQHLAIGQPPTFPPAFPLTVLLGMQARRRSIDTAIEVHVDSLEIATLR